MFTWEAINVYCHWSTVEEKTLLMHDPTTQKFKLFFKDTKALSKNPKRLFNLQ